MILAALVQSVLNSPQNRWRQPSSAESVVWSSAWSSWAREWWRSVLAAVRPSPNARSTASRARRLSRWPPSFFMSRPISIQCCAWSFMARLPKAPCGMFIRQRYAKLVRNGSKFWNVSGVDVKIGLFRGAEINVESLRSLVAGGDHVCEPERAERRVCQRRDGVPSL